MNYISRIPGENDALPFPRRVALMGCTGSIGRSAFRVLEKWRESGKFLVEAMAAGRNLALLAEQAAVWRPHWLAIQDSSGPCGIDALRRLLPRDYKPEILTGPEGFAALSSLDSVDMVLSAQSGAAGLRATVAATAAGKFICLANKESLVLAGSLIRRLCALTGAVIFPVDSEHCALFESMLGRRGKDIAKLVLTASGGPFRTLDAKALERVRPKDALKHPSWTMGAKITIDSATLMNKGLEIIEACHLYGVTLEEVDVVVHPQSIVHSLVELADGSLIAQLAVPDMRIPLAASFSWPHLLSSRVTGIEPLSLAKIGALTFEAPKSALFPCLDLARRAFAEGRTVALNAANEVAVARFLRGELSFLDIPALVRDILHQAENTTELPENGDVRESLPQLLDAIEQNDAAARVLALAWRAH